MSGGTRSALNWQARPDLHDATTRFRDFTSGASDTIPMIVGAAPFGVIFGTLVASGPLHLWHGQLMSLLVFAGSAQFIALGLICARWPRSPSARSRGVRC